MTAEVSFAKGFLASLDSRPVKLQSDYAADQRTLEITHAYTLPRMPQSMKRPDKSSAPGTASEVTVSLKSLKNPPLDLSLPGQALSTSILDLKQKVAAELGLGGVEKIRLLFAKKPCSDSKTIKDLIGDSETTKVEISVMIIGGMPQKPSEPSSTKTDVPMEDAPVAQGESGLVVLDSAEFWTDLQGFLEQRIRNQEVAEKAKALFAKAWKEQL